MKKVTGQFQTRNHGRIALAVLVAFASSAVKSHASPDRWRGLLEKDSAAVVGRWIESRLLQRKLERLTTAANYGDVELTRKNYRVDPSEILEAKYNPTLGSYMGSMAGIGIAGTGGTNASTPRFVFKASLYGAGAGLGVAISVTGLQISNATSSAGKSPSSNDGEEAIRYSIDPGKVRNEAVARTEAANAKQQAAFIGELKKTSLEISTRLASMLGVPESGRLEFEQGVERRILVAFRAQSKWDANTKVQLNITEALRSVMDDAEERVSLFDQVVIASRKQAHVPATLGEARIAYDTLVRESEELIKTSIDAQRTHIGSKDSRIAAVAREFGIFAAEQEAFVEKLKLNQRLLQ